MNGKTTTQLRTIKKLLESPWYHKMNHYLHDHFILSNWTEKRERRAGASRSFFGWSSLLLPSQVVQPAGRGGGFHYYVDGSVSPPVAKSTPKKRSQIIVRSEANHVREGGEQPIHVFLGSGTSGTSGLDTYLLGRDGACGRVEVYS